MATWFEQEAEKTRAALSDVEDWIATGVVDLGLGADFVACATKLADRLEAVFVNLPEKPPTPKTTATVEFEETILESPRRQRVDTRAGRLGDFLLTVAGLAGSYGVYLHSGKVVQTTRTVALPKEMLPGSGPVTVEVAARKLGPARARPPATWRARMRRSWLRLKGRAQDDSPFEPSETFKRLRIEVPGIPFDPDPVVRAYEVRNLEIYRDRLQIKMFLEEYDEKVEKLTELTRDLEGKAAARRAEIDALERSTNSGADFDDLRKELAQVESDLPALEARVTDQEGRLEASLAKMGRHLPEEGDAPRGPREEKRR